jgi:hypothetical protein
MSIPSDQSPVKVEVSVLPRLAPEYRSEPDASALVDTHLLTDMVRYLGDSAVASIPHQRLIEGHYLNVRRINRLPNSSVSLGVLQVIAPIHIPIDIAYPSIIKPSQKSNRIPPPNQFVVKTVQPGQIAIVQRGIPHLIRFDGGLNYCATLLKQVPVEVNSVPISGDIMSYFARPA